MDKMTRLTPLRITVVLLALGGVYYVTAELIGLTASVEILLHAAWEWMFVAVSAMLLTFGISAGIQYVAGGCSGKLGDVLLLGLAGSFLNHFLPFSVGGVGLLANYYHRLGQSKAQAAVTAILPIAIGAIVSLCVALIIAPVGFNQWVHSIKLNVPREMAVLSVLGIVTLISVIIVKNVNRLRVAVRSFVKDLRRLHNYRQIALTALGSVIMLIVAASVLYASLRAVGAEMTTVAVMILFVTSLFISETAPTPGGIGATEAILILGMTGAGLAPPQALAATFIFRIISFALPALPGVVALLSVERILGGGHRVFS